TRAATARLDSLTRAAIARLPDSPPRWRLAAQLITAGRPWIAIPPSTTKHCPVMYDAAGIARNATAVATSRGSAMRPSGVRLGAREHGLDQRRARVPGRDGVDPDAVARPLERQGARGLGQPGLGRR